MAALVCLGCKTTYSVGAPKCPQCGGKKHTEQGSKSDPTLEAQPADTVDSASSGAEVPDA